MMSAPRRSFYLMDIEEVEIKKDPRPLKFFRPALKTDFSQNVDLVRYEAQVQGESLNTPIKSSVSSPEKVIDHQQQHQQLTMKKKKFYGSGRTQHSQQNVFEEMSPKEETSQKEAKGKISSQNWRLKDHGPRQQ